MDNTGKTVAIVIGIIILGALLWSVLRAPDSTTNVSVTGDTDTVTPTTGTPTNDTTSATPSNSVLLSESNPGSVVTVSSAVLTKPGYIVISAINGTGDSIGEAKQVGLSSLLPAGSYKNIQIQLAASTTQSQTLVAVLYQDNGNGTFKQGDDVYLSNSNARIVSDVDVVGMAQASESATLQLQIETFMEKNYPASTTVGAGLPG